MPIQIVEGLPVIKKLEEERVYTIEKSRALTQDIRPLKILILNLMPKKKKQNYNSCVCSEILLYK